MIKKILIGAGIVIVAAGAALGVLYFIQKSQPTTTTPEEQPPEVVLDFSKDYGACSSLDVSTVKTALGDAAVNLQPPENIGIVGNQVIGEDVENTSSDAQICVYAFEPGGTLENGFNSGNALMVQVTKYANEPDLQTIVNQIESDEFSIAVDGLGDSAFYNAPPIPQGPDTSYILKLSVFTAKTLTEYSINQPTELATFTAESGKAALVQLATLAAESN
jgi:hypothetical protein